MINKLALILDMDPLYLIGVSDANGRITYGEEDPVKEALRCAPRNKLLEYMAIITEELGKR